VVRLERHSRKEGNVTRDEKADAAIRDHVGYAMVASAIPVPIADVLAVTAVQLDLVRQLAGLYEMKYDETWGKATVSALTASSAARWGASAVKAVAGVGAIVGGGAQAMLSGASTYAIGQLFKLHFEAEGTIDTFNPERARAAYDRLVETGKSVATSLIPSPRRPRVEDVHTVAETLERLARLRESGAITQEEFDRLKAQLLPRA
jgi:uncharacterized protein (DUF697 family)